MRVGSDISSITLAASAARALAQGFPDKMVRLTLPYPPGGNIDLTASIKERGAVVKLKPSGLTKAPVGTGTTHHASACLHHKKVRPANKADSLIGGLWSAFPAA